MQSNLAGIEALLKESFWYPEFGVEVPNKMLELSFNNNQLNINFEWSKN